MALVNQAKREINAKIVFYGPGLSGKATNVKHVFNKLKPEFRGALKAMKVQDARMLFFDFTPPGDSSVDGYKVRFHLYTVSGPVVDPGAWKMVLKGVDGIVFVADSSAGRKDANRESLDNLAGYLKGYGQSLSSLPLVFQYNKSDLEDSLPAAELERLLNPARFPSFVASSQNGEGVLQTALGLVKTVLTGLRDKGLEGVAAGEALQRMVQPSAPPSATAAPAAHAEGSSPALAGAAPTAPPAPTAQEAKEVSPAFETRQAPEPSEAEWPPGTPRPASGGEFGVVETEWPPPYGPAGDREPAAQGEGAKVSEEPLSLELAGNLESVAPGRFRLPLTIRSGARSKAVMLNLDLSIDEVNGRGA
jgi:signal recognition particle receptor subunit beta